MRNPVMLAMLALALASPAGAQSKAAGKWNMQLGEWQSDAGGNIQIQSPDHGVLDITMKGDSATASFSLGNGSPPLVLQGMMSGGKLMMSGKREGHVNVNGEESTVTLTIEFELTPAAGELNGVMRLKRDADAPVWRTAKGTPVK